MTWCDRRLGSVVVAASTLLMLGCGSNGSGNADLITPDQAKAVALAHLERPTTSAEIRDETGSLHVIDQALLTLNPLPTPEPTLDPGIGHNVTVWVAHQHSYPISFLCFDSPTVPGAAARPTLLNFDKANTAAPWKVTYRTDLASMTTVPNVAVDSQGYAQLIPASRYGAFSVPPAQIAGDYAAYLTAGNSADVHEFGPGGLTSAVIDGDKKLAETLAQQKADALTVSFSPTDDPVAAYLTSDGGALVLFGIRSVSRHTPTKGVLTVSKDGKGVLGPTPGRYRQFTNELILLLAFVDPLRGSTDKPSGIGAYEGAVRSTGIRA